MTMAKAKQAAVGDNSNDPAEVGHNSKELTSEERAALRMHHIRQLLKVEDDMKPLRELRKKIRAEAKGDGFKLAEIDAGIRLATMEDQSIFVAEIKELIEIARSFNALPPGGQGDLFPDRRPKDEKRFAEGKQAGLEGRNPEPPYGVDSPDGQAWMSGWHEGQRIMRDDLLSAMQKRAAKDELIKAGGDDPFEDEQRVAAE
jgi:ribosome modulation factor